MLFRLRESLDHAARSRPSDVAHQAIEDGTLADCFQSSADGRVEEEALGRQSPRRSFSYPLPAVTPSTNPNDE